MFNFSDHFCDGKLTASTKKSEKVLFLILTILCFLHANIVHLRMFLCKICATEPYGRGYLYSIKK